MPLEKNLVVLEDLLLDTTVVQQLRGGVAFAVTPINPQNLFKTATMLAPDYPFRTWVDSLTNGAYEVLLTTPQFGLPAGTWYIWVTRAAVDTLASQNRLLIARLSTDSTVQYSTVCVNGVWTLWLSSTAVTHAVATAAATTTATAIAVQPALRPATGTAGLAQVFGNNGGWKYATGGGSRLFLGKVDPLNAVAPFSYQFIDMSDSAHLSFDVNIDTLPAGVVFASYLVPMKTNMATSLSLPVIGNTVLNAGITANPALADEWGIGYGDAQGVNTIYTPEVDVFEASGIGAQVTLHGYDRSVGQTGLGGIDNPGVWSSVHGLSGTTQFPAASVAPSGVYDPMTFGPGTQFMIDTQQSMHIDATFIGPNNVVGVTDTLTMTVVISQGVNSITKTVTSVGFTVADLQKMVYTSSIWATDTIVSATDTSQTSNTWWLDGVADHTTNATTDQRGWGLPAGIVPTDGTLPAPTPAIVPAGILNPMFTDYNAYSTQMSFYIKMQDITNAGNQRPVCARTGNLQFDMVDTLGNAITVGTTMAWTLDVKYRGVVNLGTPYNHINFWSGRYNASYGVYTQDIADTITPTAVLTTGLIPSMLPSDPLPPVFTTYSAGIGSSTGIGNVVNPPTIASLQALISTASGATYLESIANVVIPTAVATVPWNYIPADNIGLQTYSNAGVTNTQAAAIVTATAHSALLNNPHQVTKAQVGLPLVPNTDFTAAVSLNTAKVSDINHVAALLPNVNNTSDLAKPISTLTQTALNAKLATTQKAAVNGVASLDAASEVVQAQAGAAAQVAAGLGASSKRADGTWSKKAVWLGVNYPLQTWVDTLVSGVLYDVSLTIPQNGLSTGYWYVEVIRHNNDIAGNNWRVIRCTSFGTGGNTPNLVYQSTCSAGVWTPFIKTVMNTPLVWTDATVTLPWVQHPSVSYHLRYAKDSNSTVFLAGNVYGGVNAADATLATLPVGYRPLHTSAFPFSTSGGGTCYGEINPSGAIYYYGARGFTGNPNAYMGFSLAFKGEA